MRICRHLIHYRAAAANHVCVFVHIARAHTTLTSSKSIYVLMCVRKTFWAKGAKLGVSLNVLGY